MKRVGRDKERKGGRGDEKGRYGGEVSVNSSFPDLDE